MNFWLSVVLALFLLSLLFGFDPRDAGWHQIGWADQTVHHYFGAFGAWWSSLLIALFGYAAYLWPIAVLFFYRRPGVVLFGLIFGLFNLSALLNLYQPQALIFGGGGVIGQWINQLLWHWPVNIRLILFWLGLLLSLHYLVHFSWLKLADWIGAVLMRDKMDCIRCLISGKVQGVWFRKYTRQKMAELGLQGKAVNLSDGRVEVIACGQWDALNDLKQWLWQGSPLSEVKKVECEPWHD